MEEGRTPHPATKLKHVLINTLADIQYDSDGMRNEKIQYLQRLISENSFTEAHVDFEYLERIWNEILTNKKS